MSASLVAGAGVGSEMARSRPRRELWARLIRRPSARAGLALAVLVALAVTLGCAAMPYDPNKIDLANKLLAPTYEHPLGTDQFGRDQLTRVLDGGRRSLGAALLVLASVLGIGLVMGITAGIVGGAVDAVLMRIVDVLLALPSTVLALAVVGVLGVGFQNLLLAMIFSWWAYYARLSRGYVLVARQRQDVVADRLAGIGWPRIIAGHIVPGVLSQLLIVGTLDLGGVIIGIAGLSFLGLGVQPPYAEWGAMLSGSRLYFAMAPWLLLGPAVPIFLSVAAANLVGNALRDAADSSRAT